MNLNEINYVKTKEEVTNIFSLYKMLLLKLEEKSMPKITNTYGYNFGGQSGSRYSKLENFTLKKILAEEKLNDCISLILGAINKLDIDERKYLYFKYLGDLRLSDEEIMEKMNYSEKTFRLLKRDSVVKFAFVIGKLVYKED